MENSVRMNEKLRLALIGVGHVAEHQIAALAASEYWSLVAAADIRPERQCLLPPGVVFLDSAEALLQAADADLFLVATPNKTHYDIGRIVLAHGANLLLEKPCCSTADELDELLNLAREGGCFLAVALHARHALDLRWFQQHHAELGLPLDGITRFECRFYDPYIRESGLALGARSLSGSWFDSGINALSVVASLIPAATISVASGRFVPSGLDGCADSAADVDFVYSLPGGLGTGSISTSWTMGINSKTTRLIFERQGVEVLLDHSNETVVITRQGSTPKAIDLRNSQPRLVNHYVGVLNRAREMFRTRETNIDLAVSIHKLLFDGIALSGG